MPVMRYQGGSFSPVYFPRWKYRGGQTLTMTGAPVAATIPNDTDIVEIKAETGAVYFNLNHANANANSPGYIPQDTGEILGPFPQGGLTALTLYGDAGNIAHIIYFQEVGSNV